MRRVAIVAALVLATIGCANLSDAEDGTDFDAAAAQGADTGSRSADASGHEDALQGKTKRIRIVAANLSSGKKQSYDPGHGKRILQGLKPDIVLIQEFNVGNNGAAAVAAFVTDTFGVGFSTYRESGLAIPNIPNGVISRFPILESGSWDDSNANNREFAWARIDVPGTRDLWAVSLHLLTSSSSARAEQIKQLVGYIEANVPASDLLVVGGDLNTNTVSEASLKGFDGLLDRQRKPADLSGNGHTNAPRNKPYDRLFADSDLEGLSVAVAIGSRTFDNGLVFDSRVYSPLADVAPVQQGDSGAESMQHMAVVRDFSLVF